MSYTYDYPRTALTVDALVIALQGKERSILLVKRGNEPYKNQWALPGGFMNMDETLLQACLRELQEETGLQLNDMEQFRVFDALDRDPRHRTISVVFYAYLSEILPVSGGDDAAKASWFPLPQLPPLAFDHAAIVTEFLSKSKQQLK